QPSFCLAAIGVQLTLSFGQYVRSKASRPRLTTQRKERSGRQSSHKPISWARLAISSVRRTPLEQHSQHTPGIWAEGGRQESRPRSRGSYQFLVRLQVKLASRLLPGRMLHSYSSGSRTLSDYKSET